MAVQWLVRFCAHAQSSDWDFFNKNSKIKRAIFIVKCLREKAPQNRKKDLKILLKNQLLQLSFLSAGPSKISRDFFQGPLNTVGRRNRALLTAFRRPIQGDKFRNILECAPKQQQTSFRLHKAVQDHLVLSRLAVTLVVVVQEPFRSINQTEFFRCFK